MANPIGDPFSEELKKLCWDNAEFFKKDDSENGQRLRLGFLGIIDHVSTIVPLVSSIQTVMADYDFNTRTPGNGYRSFVVVVHASFKHGLQLCKYVALNRDSIIFRKGLYMKEVEAVAHMIASLCACFQHLQTLLNWSEPGELFPGSDHHAEILLEQSDSINQYAFYGRCLGIQFCDSVQPLLKFISTIMASFSEVYYNFGSISKAQSFVSGGKFLIDPELRARRIVNISQFASIDFCKSFWFLAESELMKRIPDFVCNAIAINTEIEIPPEPLQMENSDGVKVDIPIPSSHIKINSIHVRLLSSSKREGMISVSSESNKKTHTVPPSDSIILHCHGGGFVAQSSKSHEVYLRDWASTLNIPIVSVDYSLAPEAPFPRALEEVFYAYCWAVKNSKILGSTGEKFILAGDSAGANLLLGVALKCIEYDIRKPNGLFLAYVPVIVSSTPSPSRLLCLMDPLLPIGFLLRCLKAYACPKIQTIEPLKSKFLDSKNLRVDNSLKFVERGEHSSDSSKISLEAEDIVGQCSTKVSSPFKTSADPLAGVENFKGFEKTLAFDLTEEWEGSSDESFQRSDGSYRNVKNTFSSMKKRVSNLISNTLKIVSRRDIDKALTGSDIENIVNPFKEFKFTVPKDPYLSPYWASDEILRELPPTSICSVQFDPCLDDCVMFAKKLKRLGNRVTLDILEGLPHGFLNFSKMSGSPGVGVDEGRNLHKTIVPVFEPAPKVNKDAEEGSKLCMERIKELLNLEI